MSDATETIRPTARSTSAIAGVLIVLTRDRR